MSREHANVELLPTPHATAPDIQLTIPSAIFYATRQCADTRRWSDARDLKRDRRRPRVEIVRQVAAYKFFGCLYLATYTAT